MKKTEKLVKFHLDSIDELCEDALKNVVTWNLDPVDIVGIMRTTSGERLVGIIRGNDYDTIHTFTLDGRCVGANNGDLDLYINDSIDIWFNLTIENGAVIPSKGYYSEEDALSDRTDNHFDTVCVEVSGSTVMDYLRSHAISEELNAAKCATSNESEAETDSIPTTAGKFKFSYTYTKKID